MSIVVHPPSVVEIVCRLLCADQTIVSPLCNSHSQCLIKTANIYLEEISSEPGVLRTTKVSCIALIK